MSCGVFPHKDVPFGIPVVATHHLGDQIPPKNNLGAQKGFYRPNAQNIETCILSKLLHWFQPNFAQYKRPPSAHSRWSKYGPTNPRWQTAAILKKRYITISPQLFDRFWWNLAKWRILTPYSGNAVKIFFRFLKTQDGGKNRDISATVRPIFTKFGTLV